MTMQRREFLVGAGAGALLGTGVAARTAAASDAKAADLSTWAAVRDQFALSREHIHMALLLFASHPKPVRDAFEQHRRGFDANPVVYLHENIERCEAATRASVATYVGGAPEEIALTGNTTTGIALL
jgi:isopenicillin-N epimerase